MSKTPQPRGWKAFRVHIVVALVAALVLVAGGLAIAQDRTVTPAVAIRQDQLGSTPVSQVLESGRQFFAVSFLPADGHGEGNTGPRASQRTAMWQTALHDPLLIPFLRVNGLDSQSCFACHNTAGTYVPDGQSARTQKPGGVGGAGDFAVALLGSGNFPKELTHILRAPPRAFGSAYLQELAEEMTGDLLAIRQDAINQAQANPGTTITEALVTKTIGFGKIHAYCSPFTFPCTVSVDTSDVEGVSPDLIVRPLQHKGVAATLRSFVKSALNFHHSMQAVEVVGVNNDCDADGLINEMAVDVVTPATSNNDDQVQQSLGDVAALSAFTGMLRPPTTGPDSHSADHGRIDLRRHRLHQVPRAEPEDRPPPAVPHRAGRAGRRLPEQLRPVRLHPARQLRRGRRRRPPGGQGGDQHRRWRWPARRPPTARPGFYCIDLTNPGSGLSDEFLPRLPANPDGTVTVNLYSDLKRHEMGYDLEQLGDEQEDDSGDFGIPNEQYLTSKLWGVADNGPWLHDGRARTLSEAIVMHGGEAAPQSAAFQALSTTDQQAVIDFLETLIIPPSP